MERVKILSLGAGVQSTALLLMSIKGVLPRVDHAVFADTQWEPQSVYDHLDWLVDESTAAGIPIHKVTAGDLSEAAAEVRLSKKSGNTYIRKAIPLYIMSPEGKKGHGMRTCTMDYKIKPLDKFARQFKKQGVECWMGISRDEMQRIRSSKHLWKTNCYPLLQMNLGFASDDRSECNYLDRQFTRQDCIDWMAENYPGRKMPRSACVSCPYHGDSEWRRLRDSEPAEFSRACEDEKRLQASYAEATAIKGTPWLHRSCVPLAEAPIDKGTDAQDFVIGMNNECEGMCGV